jgi:hypothetical protein
VGMGGTKKDIESAAREIRTLLNRPMVKTWL